MHAPEVAPLCQSPPNPQGLTLLAWRRLLLLLRGRFSFVWDFIGVATGHVELVDVQRGLAEGGHGGVDAGVAIGGAAERGQVQRLAAGDDGDVEGQLPAAAGRRRLADGERRRRRELAVGSGGLGGLPVEQLVVLAVRKQQLQGPGGHGGERLSWPGDTGASPQAQREPSTPRPALGGTPAELGEQ